MAETFDFSNITSLDQLIRLSNLPCRGRQIASSSHISAGHSNVFSYGEAEGLKCRSCQIIARVNELNQIEIRHSATEDNCPALGLRKAFADLDKIGRGETL
jgi:hypothetical protein